MLHFAKFVRRSVEVISDPSSDVPVQITHIKELIDEMPPWGLPVMFATLLAGVLLIASVRYTLQSVVTTLAMVESPQTTVIVREEKPKLEYSDAEEAIDSEVIVIKQIPITSRIRTTLRHLQSRGGFAARWRGLSAFCAWTVGYAVITTLISNAGLYFVEDQPEMFALLVEHVASVGAFVVLARIGLTWTHIVISQPSPKTWFQRIPGRKAWRQIRKPTLYTALAWQLNKIMPAAVAWSLGLDNTVSPFDDQTPEAVLLKISAVGLIAVVTFVGITIPAEVALTRVQASLLPEEDESIVSFDRTFSGAVAPEVVGGSGKLGYLQAWQSFDGAARLRLLKLYVKVFMVDVALHVFVVMALATEFLVLVGPKAYDLLNQLAGAGAGAPVDMAQARYEAVVLG